jgi:hypothetical protein
MRIFSPRKKNKKAKKKIARRENMSKRLLKRSKDKEARKNRVETLTNDMEVWFEHFLAYVTKDERNVERKKTHY